VVNIKVKPVVIFMWAAPPQCGYWGSMGFFCSAPQDFGLLGVFCARFPPREASIIFMIIFMIIVHFVVVVFFFSFEVPSSQKGGDSPRGVRKCEIGYRSVNYAMLC
jgi:hypothetical protein